ncbi:MAG: hypothetical protein ACLFT0_09525 [Spirulinaceae cyanobacterium]
MLAYSLQSDRGSFSKNLQNLKDSDRDFPATPRSFPSFDLH